MDRATPVRKPYTSTADLLTWSEVPPADSSVTASGNASRAGARSHQPSDGISKVLSGGQITDEEAEILNKRKPCSGYKLREITGSKIFATDGEDGMLESGAANPNLNNRTTVRTYQQTLNGISQISFSAEGNVSPKKPSTLTEVAKQRELSGTLESELDAKIKKQLSDAKCKELSGHDIFGPPPEIPPRSLAAARTLESKDSKDIGEPAPRNVRTSVKVSNPAGGQSNILFGEEPAIKTAKKIHNQKFAGQTPMWTWFYLRHASSNITQAAAGTLFSRLHLGEMWGEVTCITHADISVQQIYISLIDNSFNFQPEESMAYMLMLTQF